MPPSLDAQSLKHNQPFRRALHAALLAVHLRWQLESVLQDEIGACDGLGDFLEEAAAGCDQVTHEVVDRAIDRLVAWLNEPDRERSCPCCGAEINPHDQSDMTTLNDHNRCWECQRAYVNGHLHLTMCGFVFADVCPGGCVYHPPRDAHAKADDAAAELLRRGIDRNDLSHYRSCERCGDPQVNTTLLTPQCIRCGWRSGEPAIREPSDPTKPLTVFAVNDLDTQVDMDSLFSELAADAGATVMGSLHYRNAAWQFEIVLTPGIPLVTWLETLAEAWVDGQGAVEMNVTVVDGDILLCRVNLVDLACYTCAECGEPVLPNEEESSLCGSLHQGCISAHIAHCDVCRSQFA